MTGWEKPLGILMLFALSWIGFLLADDKKLKWISFFVGVTAAITLAGWSEGIISHAEQALGSLSGSIKPDMFGVATSALALGSSYLIPSKNARRAVQTTSASGLALSLLGVPTWIIWFTWLIIVVAIIVLAYFAVKRVANWISTMVKGS